MADDTLPDGTSHSVDLGVATPGAPHAPQGPEVLDIPIPGGVFEPAFGGFNEPNPQTPKITWADTVDETAVLCFGCEFGWIMWKHAPTRNIKPDGTPFLQREGYCLYSARSPGGAPLPLDMRFVLKCNAYRPKEDLEASRATSEQPHASGADIDEPEWAGKPHTDEETPP